MDIQANCRKFNVEQNREYLNGPIDAHVTSQQVAWTMNRGATPSSNNMNPLLDFNHQILDFSQTHKFNKTNKFDWIFKTSNQHKNKFHPTFIKFWTEIFY